MFRLSSYGGFAGCTVPDSRFGCEESQMARLKIAIDNDIDFLVFNAEAAAFGYSAKVELKMKKTGTSDVRPTLPGADVFDLSSDQHEIVHAGHEDDEE